MKKIFLTSIILFLSVTIISAQQTVGYDINLTYNCDGNQAVILKSGSVSEGVDLVFPALVIPPEYSYLQNFQKYLDIFADAVVEIPVGTLSEDVTFQIYINPFPCESDVNYLELFGLTVKVIGSNSGEHPILHYYEFNEGKFVTLKLKAANVEAFLAQEGVKIEDIIAWFIDAGMEADLQGITFQYTVGEEWAYIYFSHFSKIAFGVKNSPTGMESKDILPTEYKLDQNYPNPFNPTTKIAFSLPYSGFTKLTVYNSIGVEVKTLVSEEKSAGKYEVIFNASNLSSGIYFYDLQSGNFRSTKKMILIK